MIHIVCPHCTAVNRIPAGRSPRDGRCGTCHQPLFTSHPVILDGVSFDRHLQRSDIPLLVDFWAEWCGPCKMMAPVFQRAAAVLEPQLRLAKVDTEAERRLAQQFNIRSIPTLILFKNGQEAARLAGAVDLVRLLDWVRGQL
jgi:thioredoxin 2